MQRAGAEPAAAGGSAAGQEPPGLRMAKDGRWGTEALFSCAGRKQRRGLYPGEHRARHASAPDAVPSASLTAAASQRDAEQRAGGVPTLARVCLCLRLSFCVIHSNNGTNLRDMLPAASLTVRSV